MPLTVSQIRAREDAVDVAYLIAFDCLPDLYVTGHPGEGLIGSGAGSWIGGYEDAISDSYRRTVRAGLVMPGSMSLERMDEKTGRLEGQQVTFTIVDFDGTVAATFSQEGKDHDRLAEDIQPGTSALGVSVTIQDGGTVNPRDRYIGLERIGPSGQRVDLSCLPFTRIGPHHAFNAYGQQDDGPAEVLISEQPIAHAGRLVAVYRIYRDPFTGEWPTWDEQYEGGGLVWVGKMLDNGEIKGDRSWTVKCAGWESLLQRQLNSHAITEWMPVVPSVELGPSETGLAIRCSYVDFATDENTLLSSASFDATTPFPTTLTRADAFSTLSADLDDVVDGTLTDFGGATSLSDINNGNCTILQSGIVRIRTDHGAPANNTNPPLFCEITMHEKVWRILGWDPPLQNSGSTVNTDQYRIKFVKESSGNPLDGIASVAPGDGYWRGTFTTIELNEDTLIWGANNGGLDNRGAWREYWPLYQGEIQILAAEGNQQFGLGYDFPFVESDPAVPFSSAQIGGNDVEGARHFVFRGKIAKAVIGDDGVIHAYDNGATLDGSDVEGTDLVMPARVEFVQSSYGQLTEVDGNATARISRWYDPRHFGWNHTPLDGEWVGVSSVANPDYQIACLPLASYGYNDSDVPAQYRVQGTALDLASDVLTQLLLSTGTAPGWSDAYDSAPTFTRGDNMVAGDSFWAGDIRRHDLGLAIPHQLVADVDEIAAAFDELPGGVTGPLNHVRYCYAGPFESLDLLESILRPRGLAISLRGGRLGVVRLGSFSPANADVEIGEGDLDDVYGESIGQEQRAMGQLDKTKLALRWDCVAEEHAREITIRARDGGARDRLGDLEIDLRDDGVCPFNAPGIDALGTVQALRELWAKDRPEFFSRRHFKVTGLRITRIKGQDIHVGTRILLSNPWVMRANGIYGITSAPAIITSVTLDTAEHVYICEALVFAGQDDMRLWGPIARVESITGANVVVDESDGVHALASDFAIPAWSSGTNALVRFLTWDGSVWALSSSAYTVSSVAGSTVTLTGSPGLPIRDRDVYLVMAEYDTQTSTAWPRDALYATVLGNFFHGATPTKGVPLSP